MWKATLDGRELQFDLVGINNQNFIMADRQTGSWWQQVTGEAIQGPLAGKRLERMPFDQVTFGVWRTEYPETSVLESRPEFADRYWNELEKEEERDGSMMPFVTEEDPDDPLALGALVVAVVLPELEKAYPIDLLREQSPVADDAGGVPLIVVVADDDRSIRAFDRRLDGTPLDLYRKPGEAEMLLVDAGSGSEWDFSGTAVNGAHEGRKLDRLPVYTDYWFDWKRYNEGSPVYSAGLRGAGTP